MLVSRAEFASQVIDSLSSGVVGIDTRGVVVLFNEGARRLLGSDFESASRALGRPASEVLDRHPQLLSLLVAALDGRSPVYRAEASLAGANGSRTAGFTLHPVRDAAGRVRGAVMLLRDLTPFEQSGERQRQQERLAALGQMAAGMAHEIRNPLAGMEVIAGLLRRRLSGEAHELAVELSEQIQSVADTVAASLDFVRPVELRREPIDIGGLLDAALRRGTVHSGLALTVERAVDSPLPELLGDFELLTSALANIVANACDVLAAGDGAEDAHLRLRVRPSRAEHSAPRPPGPPGAGGPVQRVVAARPELVISLEDNGPGIDPRERERIFYPFYTTKQSGSGIGLPQAQKIAMAHGGCITVDSGPGRGATFRVYLPAEERR